jgi:class 3 adenylate cyclase/tetratricopeptide (TPR) repeat protein
LAVQDIASWLSALGLSEYAERFAENGIDIDVLPELTDQDLEKMGVLLGHRRRMLRAIRMLDSAAITPSAASPPAPPRTGPPSQDSAERRQLTVMFCDLVGSTALSERLDPEDLRDLIGAYHRCVAETVSRFDGFVAQYMGDGVLTYFGYPQAHEDDPERAVRAGLALINAVGQLHNSAPLQVRIGIGTGLVVVGDLIGFGDSQDRGVVGETPNLAARLQAVARPNTVVIGPTTRRLLAELFEYQDLGPLDVKGFSSRIRAYEVIRPSSVESRFEALRTTATALVGRTEELEILMRRWEQAKQGDGAVVLICGEPGIGKSRITQVVLDRLRNEPHTRLRYFCSSYHPDSALYPIITHFERAAGIRREDTPEQRLAKLEAVLARSTNDLSKAIPVLADLLSIPTGERYEPLNLTPQRRKERTIDAQWTHIERLAAQQPVLMVFEDAQWSDPTSQEMLDMVVDRVATLPILLIITFRPEFAAPWMGRPHVTTLSLNRLTAPQRAEMIAHLIGGKELPREITDQIVDRTDGVPLFIEEVTKSVVESGFITEAGDGHTVAAPLAALAIPASLHASLLARLDRLAPAREIAQIAAALGRSFSHELISAVAGMPQRKVDEALEQLVGAELILRRGTPPAAEYTFKHALMQDAAYGTMLRSRRQQLHGRIATTLQRQFPDVRENEPEQLARHCTQAGLLDEAVGYLRKAGQQAVARGGMTEAVAQLRKGLDLLTALPESAGRRERELDLQVTLGQALMATKGYGAPEPGEALTRARRLCEQLDRPAQLGPIMYGQWVFHSVRGDLVQAEHHAKEVREFGEARNDAAWRCFGLTASGDVCLWLGKFTDARAYLESALSVWNPGYRAIAPLPEDPYVHILKFFYRASLCLGHLNQARRRRDEALAEARRISPYNLASMLRHIWYGNWAIEGVNSAPALLRLAEEVSAISSEHGFSLPLAFGSITRGWCLGVMGQCAEGISLIEQALKTFPRGASLGAPFHLIALADLYGKAGQPEKGLKQLADAAELVQKTQERWAEAELHRLRGILLLSMNRHAAAEDSFKEALTVARRQSAKFWELRAASSLAGLWRDQEKRKQARDLLAPIYGWFTDGFDTLVLNEAKSTLDQLPG